MKREFISIVLVILFGINLILAGELRVTQEHPFLIDGKWIPASSLEVGDELVSVDGKKIKITSIKDVFLENPVLVYNLDSSETDDFIVGEENIVVHNSESPEPIETYKFPMPEKVLSKLGRRLGIEDPKMEVILDDASPELKKLIQNEYAETLEKINPDSTLEQLEEEAFLFDIAMRTKVPYLGYSSFQEYNQRGNIKLLCRYLDSIITEKSSLRELGCSKQLDCSTASATIRKSLGKDWNLYIDRIGQDTSDITEWSFKESLESNHVFAAKKFTIANGEEYYVIANPGVQINIEPGMIFPAKSFEAILADGEYELVNLQ